jgi:hypothetical protein
MYNNPIATVEVSKGHRQPTKHHPENKEERKRKRRKKK